MRNLRNAFLAAALSVGMAACGTNIAGPTDYTPDPGNYTPDPGN